jgi:hypothetical protein
MRSLLAITIGLSALSIVLAMWGGLAIWVQAEGEPSVKMIAPPYDWEASVERSESLEELKRLCTPFAEWIQADRVFRRNQSELLHAAFSRGALLVIFLGCIFGGALAYVSYRLWRLSPSLPTRKRSG